MSVRRLAIASALACTLSATVATAAPIIENPGSTDVLFDGHHGDAWKTYESRLDDVVADGWMAPAIAKKGRKGAVTFQLDVMPDGKVDNVQLVMSRSTDSMERAAREALDAALPLPAPPSNGEKVTVTWSFFYNYDQRDAEKWTEKIVRLRSQAGS